MTTVGKHYPETDQWADRDGTVHGTGSRTPGTAREPEPVRNHTGTGSGNRAGTDLPAETLPDSEVPPEPVPGSPPYVWEPGTAALYADVAALLDGERPEPPAPVLLRRDDGVAQLDALDPPPRTVQDVQKRMKWRRQRAADVLRAWRVRRPNGACVECGRYLSPWWRRLARRWRMWRWSKDGWSLMTIDHPGW